MLEVSLRAKRSGDECLEDEEKRWEDGSSLLGSLAEWRAPRRSVNVGGGHFPPGPLDVLLFLLLC